MWPSRPGARARAYSSLKMTSWLRLRPRPPCSLRPADAGPAAVGERRSHARRSSTAPSRSPEPPRPAERGELADQIGGEPGADLVAERLVARRRNARFMSRTEPGASVSSASRMMPSSTSATVGSASITPTTWPVGRMPTSSCPSTMLALGEHRRVGGHRQLRPCELAALPHREPFPDRSRRASVLVRRRNPSALARARGRRSERGRALEAVDHVGADHALRLAVDGARDHRVGQLGLRGRPLSRSRAPCSRV